MTATRTIPNSPERVTMDEGASGDKLARDCTKCGNGTLDPILGTLMGCIDCGAYFYVSDGVMIEVVDTLTLEMIRGIGK